MLLYSRSIPCFNIPIHILCFTPLCALSLTSSLHFNPLLFFSPLAFYLFLFLYFPSSSSHLFSFPFHSVLHCMLTLSSHALCSLPLFPFPTPLSCFPFCCFAVAPSLTRLSPSVHCLSFLSLHLFLVYSICSLFLTPPNTLLQSSSSLVFFFFTVLLAFPFHSLFLPSLTVTQVFK